MRSGDAPKRGGGISRAEILADAGALAEAAEEEVLFLRAAVEPHRLGEQAEAAPPACSQGQELTQAEEVGPEAGPDNKT